MNWYRAPVLTRLVAALNRWRPKRDHKSDGSIGDRAHQARKSDHNPDPKSRPPGVVRAQDIDKDGVHLPSLIASLLLHSMTAYVISNRVIYHRTRGFRRARYTGSNPHTEHVHVSCKPGFEDHPAKFCFIDYVPDWRKGVRKGSSGQQTRQVQAMLIAHGYTLTLDGDFGDSTDKALRSFQGKRGLKVDGIAGPKTLAKMRGL